MKKHILSIASLLAVLSLNSCLQNETTINLKKDGSGTIVEETRISEQSIAMMGMTISFNGDDAETQAANPLKEMLSEERAKERAKELGEGVTFLKAEPVTVGTNKGARITYQFKDINKVRLSAMDGVATMMEPESEADDMVIDKDYIDFNYKNGVLTINEILAEDGDKPAEENQNDGVAIPKELPSRQELAMLKQGVTDMEMSLKLVIESGIAETNATHRDDNTITILKMDMNQVMKTPDGLEKFLALRGMNSSDFVKNITTIDGIKLEGKPEITIKLK